MDMAKIFVFEADTAVEVFIVVAETAFTGKLFVEHILIYISLLINEHILGDSGRFHLCNMWNREHKTTVHDQSIGLLRRRSKQCLILEYISF